MTAFPSYSTGTISIAADATSVVGTGSNWSGQNAMAGDLLVVTGFGSVPIVDVTDPTHLAIDAWPFGAVTAGTTYSIKKDSLNRVQGIQTAQAVDKMVSAMETNGLYVFVRPDDTEPDPSFGDDDQYALQATTGKIWQKVGGVWEFVGTFKGFGTPAPWDSATAYVAFDVVSFEGASYVCIQNNTNEQPSFGDSPPNEFWTVLAAQGEAATVEVGTVTTGAGGSSASVTNSGTSGAAVLDFTIPAGTGYGGTSTTSLAVGTGSKAFTTQAGMAYTDGARVRASSAADTTNWMEGLATYGGTTLTITVTKTNGSGTHADWNLNVVGEPGAGDLSSGNNLSDVADAATALANLGGMAKSANLSDVADADTALDNLSGVSTNAQTLTSAKQLQARHNIGTSIGVPDVIVEDQKTQGTNGGSNTAGSFQVRILNTLVRNNGTIASLASNQVTLPAGTYFFKWSVPAYAVDGHQSGLRNVTDSSWAGFGKTGFTPSTGGSMVDSEGSCVVTITASKAFSLSQYTTTSQPNLGLGRALGQATEVYSRLEITALS